MCYKIKKKKDLPQSKDFGTHTTGQAGAVFVYNAELDSTLVAWAIQKAATAGINPH